MVVILSYDGDAATTEVIDWLEAFGCGYRRINLANENFRNISVELRIGFPIATKLLLQNGEVLDVAEVSYFLFRGGLFSFDQKFNDSSELPKSLAKTYLQYEFDSLTQFFYKQIAAKCLGNPLFHPLNKIEQLEAALAVGLNIPSTFITNSRAMLHASTLGVEKTLLTKAIQENVFAYKKQHFYDIKASEIEVEGVDESFYPSLFQKSISKALEIRVFYLDGKCYALGMLLCSSEERVIDFRTATKKLRYCRYQLPEHIEGSLIQLMNQLKLKTGSIDMLVDTNNEYYFLEVNPTGQLGWVSAYGNYYLEKKIAEYLVAKNEAFTQAGFVASKLQVPESIAPVSVVPDKDKKQTLQR
jgi:ATP-GRASP peptide maturase of grasp-with-spasm system